MKHLIWVVAVAGLVLLGVGAAAVLREVGGAGPTALLIAGALLALSPFLVDRLERLSVGSKGVELQLSLEIADKGAVGTARIVEESGLASAAESYAFVYSELDHDQAYAAAKIHLQDALVDQAAGVARRRKFDAGEVRALFHVAPPMIRVLVLGLMEGDPSLADTETLASGIGGSQSGNEQYHALQVAKLRWLRLPDADRQRLRKIIDEDPHIPTDDDRKALAEEIRELG
jgi:hypothetical protein